LASCIVCLFFSIASRAIRGVLDHNASSRRLDASRVSVQSPGKRAAISQRTNIAHIHYET
jgi:hypothetical protein